MTEDELWPRVLARGMTINRQHEGPPGTDGIKECLTREEFKRWGRWGASGLTCGPNGVYPWDVERFLEGLPNDN